MVNIDNIDRKILDCLQKNGDLTQREIAELVGLSQNACWRRIKQLQESGILIGSRALIDASRLGMDLTVFVAIKTRFHSGDWSKQFRDHVALIPEVEAFYRIGGEWDYLLKVVTRGMSGYDSVYERLISGFELESVTGHFSMETIFQDRPLDVTE
ncbi:MAG: Lrp/AsnC family transcriptional regulator [Hyphomicrobiales bacterium]|nr:Lrp/AsnC family transcriptional regulator [Hyphomicrobiales bacterium]